jgi:dolichyl-phosphate-mannose-protein mannosyltransferase
MAIRLFGDRPWAWRVPSAVMGPLGLYAFSRALWLSSGRRFATIAGAVLLAVDFVWFVQSRIAMLDMVMAGWTMVMLWQAMAAISAPTRGRARGHLALAGLAAGLSLGAKWSVAPVLVLVPMALAWARRGESRWLAGIALWLGVVPLAVYLASFWPIAHWRENAVPLTQIVSWHRYMIELQASVVKHHPYQSVW